MAVEDDTAVKDTGAMGLRADNDDRGATPAPNPPARAAAVVRLWPIAVLVLSGDPRFRAAATTLIGRRGCTVLACTSETEALALAEAERIDVLLAERASGPRRAPRKLASAITDSLARRARSRVAPVALVVVSEARPRAAELAKWGPFDELFEAILQADGERRLPPASAGAPGHVTLRGAPAD